MTEEITHTSPVVWLREFLACKDNGHRIIPHDSSFGYVVGWEDETTDILHLLHLSVLREAVHGPTMVEPWTEMFQKLETTDERGQFFTHTDATTLAPHRNRVGQQSRIEVLMGDLDD